MGIELRDGEVREVLERVREDFEHDSRFGRASGTVLDTRERKEPVIE